MISTRDDDIPCHSSFNPSPAQSLHQQWNIPIAFFFVTRVLREGVNLHKYVYARLLFIASVFVI